jgi:uncharacterized protein (DUF433 family)
MERVQARPSKVKLIREMVGGEPYEYYPLGSHVVTALGICGGRPTFKYTRLEVAFILDLLAAGWSMEQVLQEYEASHLSADAIQEAIHLAKEAFIDSFLLRQSVS